MKLLVNSVRRCKRCLGFGYNRDLVSRPISNISDVSSKDTVTKKDEKKKKKEWPRRILTGIQPTGALHIGNYFAAVKRCVDLQNQGEDLMVCIADLHSLTTQQNGAVLQQRVLETAAVLIASGLDPDRCILWQQSAVPRHAELCWLLTCLTTLPRLHHLPQYKEKSAGEGEVGAGLLLYPVLQAADLLLYRATHAPVGADQRQHLQLAALLANTANHRLGVKLFPEPTPLLPEDGSDRVLSLRDPNKKMSKSDPSGKSRIMLTDTDDQIRIKIRKAVTDFTPHVTYSPESRAGVSNLVRLHCLSAGLTPEEAVELAGGLTTAQYKVVVSTAVTEVVAPVRSHTERLLRHPEVLRARLTEGAAAARDRADLTWDEVAAAAGLHRDDAATLRDAALTL